MKRQGIILAALIVMAARTFAAPSGDQQVKFYADVAARAEQNAEKVKADARVSATNYRQAAEMRCRQQLQLRPEYKAVAAEVDKALHVLADSRSLSPQARAAAGADFNDVNEALAKMEADAFTADPDIQAATAMLERLGSSAELAAQPTTMPADPLIPAAPPSPVTPRKTTAIPSPNPSPALFMPPSQSPAKLAASTPQSPPPPTAGANLALAALAPVTLPPPGVKLSGEQIGRIIHEGWNQLMAHNYADAIPMFDRAAGKDVRDLTLLTGRGICEYETKDYKASDKDLDRAYSIASAGGATRVPRQLVIAYAAAEIMNGNPMRGVRILQEMTKPTFKSGKLDEEIQNDLGIALSHADAQAHQMDLYRDALKYYLDYDKSLGEHQNDGTARWGISWIDTATAAKKWQTYRDAVANADQAIIAFQKSGKVMEVANDHYQEITGGLRLHSTAEIEMYTNEYHQGIALQYASRARMNAAVAQLQTVEKPPFPERIEHDWSEPR